MVADPISEQIVVDNLSDKVSRWNHSVIDRIKNNSQFQRMVKAEDKYPNKPSVDEVGEIEYYIKWPIFIGNEPDGHGTPIHLEKIASLCRNIETLLDRIDTSGMLYIRMMSYLNKDTRSTLAQLQQCATWVAKIKNRHYRKQEREFLRAHPEL